MIWKNFMTKEKKKKNVRHSPTSVSYDKCFLHTGACQLSSLEKDMQKWPFGIFDCLREVLIKKRLAVSCPQDSQSKPSRCVKLVLIFHVNVFCKHCYKTMKHTITVQRSLLVTRPFSYIYFFFIIYLGHGQRNCT